MIEIENAHSVSDARAWQQEIPGMGIAVSDGHMAMRMVALQQLLGLVDEAPIQGPPLLTEAITKQIGEAVVMAGECLYQTRRIIKAHPGADGVAETRMVPPRCMPAGERRYDRHRLIA
ncbi:hypothetical protein ACVWZV_001379 [Bradyrhizobium sp. GM5.1]